MEVLPRATGPPAEMPLPDREPSVASQPDDRASKRRGGRWSRARHLRRRQPSRSLFVTLAVAVAVLAGVSGAALLRGGGGQIGATVHVAGTSRPVSVPAEASVADILSAAHVGTRPGRLLAVVSRKVLDPAKTPPVVAVDGTPAALSAHVRPGALLEVTEPVDVTEDVIETGDVPAPPEPDVISSLWHPGRPGGQVTRKGAVSGEVVSQSGRLPPTPPAPVTEKLVALTFDDGPWPTTPEVLRILREKNVKATFCVVTRQLAGDRLAFAEAALADGHHLCNHTVDHDEKLPSKTQKLIDDELIGANNQLSQRLGLHPTYYRPPGGNLGPAVVATAKAQGQQVLLWTVDTKDYTKPPPAALIGAVVSQVKPGAIVLLHDGGGDRSSTIAALPTIIDQLRAAGYQLVLPDAIGPVPVA